MWKDELSKIVSKERRTRNTVSLHRKQPWLMTRGTKTGRRVEMMISV
jgi:hypothetical protein